MSNPFSHYWSQSHQNHPSLIGDYKMYLNDEHPCSCNEYYSYSQRMRRRVLNALEGTSLHELISAIADFWEIEYSKGKPLADRLRKAMQHHTDD
jgi:hypothetical protein